MSHNEKKHIFQRGSRTYYYSSVFFPKEIRQNVTILYAFVRTADNFVDQVPQDRKGFDNFVRLYKIGLEQPTGNHIVDDFISLMKKEKIKKEWVNAFLKAMRQDLSKKTYRTMQETENYMYGSAEVIGLIMAKILKLPEDSYPLAKRQGKAMQFINFIRDIQEDTQFGRTYLPRTILTKYALPDLSETTARNHPNAFIASINELIAYYFRWQEEAEKGYYYLPKRYRIPVTTAALLYKWTAKEIQRDPFIVYRTKVKPSLFRISMALMKASIRSYG